MEAHAAWMSPHARGFLVPGSTGDGWELDESTAGRLVAAAVARARATGSSLLVGALRRDSADALRAIVRFMELLGDLTGVAEPLARLASAGVAGFAVCPQSGPGLDEEAIAASLEGLLDLGLPLALYQLPQVTGNELSPAGFARLAARYPNFLMWKDSSGLDRVALSRPEAGGIFLARGAEGSYARWLKDAGGPYDGFLLSAANSFPSGLATLAQAVAGGRATEAAALSASLDGAVTEVFGLVAGLRRGNAFANANKAMEHFMAFGPGAAGREGPVLSGGERMPAAIIAATEEVLRRRGLMPERGYLEETRA
jgi:dihydrodipicolinate synthase/N-acetylneuraminate lyase